MTLSILQQIKGRLVVFCQALDDEPLHSDFIMAPGAGGRARRCGGDPRQRRRRLKPSCAPVALPVIGIIKRLCRQRCLYHADPA